jgi:hypothetical protein
MGRDVNIYKGKNVDMDTDMDIDDDLDLDKQSSQKCNHKKKFVFTHKKKYLRWQQDSHLYH